jgi:hypothetical protein
MAWAFDASAIGADSGAMVPRPHPVVPRTSPKAVATRQNFRNERCVDEIWNTGSPPSRELILSQRPTIWTPEIPSDWNATKIGIGNQNGQVEYGSIQGFEAEPCLVFYAIRAISAKLGVTYSNPTGRFEKGARAAARAGPWAGKRWRPRRLSP